MATAGGADGLYPSAFAATIGAWLGTARGIEQAAAGWCQPGCQAADGAARATARQQLEAALAQLEAALAGGSTHLVGAAATIADVAGVSALLALYQEVLSQEVQQQYAAVTRWLQACAALPQFAAVLGESCPPAAVCLLPPAVACLLLQPAVGSMHQCLHARTTILPLGLPSYQPQTRR